MRVVGLLTVAFVLAGCAIGGSKTTIVTVTRTVTSATGPKKPLPAQAETGNVKYFGRPVSITRLDPKRYALAIQPEFFLVGVTANVAFAAAQQNACQPLECAAVEDDRFVIPAGKQPLLFVLPVKTTGTVLTLSSQQQMRMTTITARELAALVGRPNPGHKLVESLDSGLWLTVDVDTVTSFAQQFQP